MARKFLYGIAGLVVLVIAVLVGLRLFSTDLTRIAMVPNVSFTALTAMPEDTYARPDMWYVRPGSGPAPWLPDGARKDAAVDAAVFFVHPTTYTDRSSWNAALDNAGATDTARSVVRTMSSPFGAAAEIWAPRYRQAAYGSFITTKPEGSEALKAAYGDVLKAFDWFVAHTDARRPIVLVGHSQGALHLTTLMRDRVAGKPLADRVAAAYVVGWSVSPAHDLPGMGMPACARAGQAGCVLSWQSYAEPATPNEMSGQYVHTALDGNERMAAAPLCTNPLTGTPGAAAPASANAGTLVASADMKTGKMVPQMVPARCDTRGLLLIGPPPEVGSFVLPGNNYHVYDIPLFWENVRRDFNNRVATWYKAHPAAAKR